MSILKRKIVFSLDTAAVDHRADFEHCPSCDKKFSGEKWDAQATALVLGIVHGKHGSLAVVSECPACFEKSWVHQCFSTFRITDDFPSDWKDVAAKEEACRHLEALRTFCDSQCSRCAHLRKLECETLPIVECAFGKKGEHEKCSPNQKFYYHRCFTETACPAFAPRANNLPVPTGPTV